VTEFVEAGDAWRKPVQERMAQEQAQREAAEISKMAEWGNREYEPDPVKRELKELNLFEVYQRWFPHKNITRSGGSNDINVQCYNESAHPRGDRNPGMSIAIAGPRAGTYYCQAQCGVEGDIIDLAAVHLGLVGGDYRKDPEDVPEIIARTAEELLGIPARERNGKWWSEQTFPTYSMGGKPLTPGATGLAAVYVPSWELEAKWSWLPEYMDPIDRIDENDAATVPTVGSEVKSDQNHEVLLNWREIIPDNTPMRTYMEIVCEDIKPEEYHFFNFLLLIGLMCGKNVYLVSEGKVFGNLLMCLTGGTGVGKTSALSYIQDIILDTCRFDPSIQNSTGIKYIKNPGSGEYMLRQFQEEFPDPNWQPQNTKDKQPMIPHVGVRGLVLWNEMSTMAAKRSAASSTVVGAVQDLYDNERLIQTGSNTAGTTHVENAFGSVVTTTQPAAVRDLLSRKDVDSGFLNRWIFVYGKGKRPRPDLIPPDLSPVKPWVIKLRQWVHGRTGHERVLRWSGDAWAEFIRRFEEIQDRFPRQDENGDPLYKRIDLLFKKFILLLTANSMSDEVPLHAVTGAWQILEYVLQCYQRFGSSLVRTELSDIQEIILDRIEKRGEKGMSIAEMDRSISKYSQEEIGAAVESLVKLDRLVGRVERQHVGRPKAKRYFVTE